MARCAICNSETELYDAGTPVCVRCSDEQQTARSLTPKERQITALLVQRIVDATSEVNAAYEEFNAVVREMPKNPAYGDGTQRIHQASQKLSVARKQMMTAHTRLNDFVGRGIVPPDLQNDVKSG
jgi:hypothetical protein